MKKRITNTKAFAMAELLVVSVIILILFSVLFSNYLPLVAQYENRINYNDVTAEYASFYVRKIYKDAMDDIDIKNQIDEKIKNGYYTVYSSTYNIKDFSFLNNYRFLEDIISEYSIDEIVITTNDLSSIKEKYERNKPLYNYINYLPKTANNDDMERYRIILRTASFGYAETEILTDSKTPLKCFKTNGSVITDYLCGKNNANGMDSITDVVIPSTINGNTITTIGEKAFFEKGIISVEVPQSVKVIEKSAFENNSISSFDYNKNGLGLKIINDFAFKNNDLKTISLLGDIEYGQGVFTNNYKLKKIDFRSDENNSIKKINDSMFSLDKVGDKTIDLVIPKSIEEIGNNAFYNIKLNSLAFEDDSNLKKVGDFAFYLSEDVNSLNNCTLVIPSATTTIGKESFKNQSFSELEFKNNSPITIGERAFDGNRLSKVLFSENISEGLNIFGDSKLGNKEGELFVRTSNMNVNNLFVSVNWCLILYGNECSGNQFNDTTYRYSYKEINKYISYKGDDTY